MNYEEVGVVKTHDYYIDNLEANFNSKNWTDLIIGMQVILSRIYNHQANERISIEDTNFQISEIIDMVDNIVNSFLEDLTFEDTKRLYSLLIVLSIDTVNLFSKELDPILKARIRQDRRELRYSLVNFYKES